MGDWPRAKADYDQAIRLAPDSAILYNHRAAALFRLQQYGQARTDLEQCQSLGGKPDAWLIESLQKPAETTK